MQAMIEVAFTYMIPYLAPLLFILMAIVVAEKLGLLIANSFLLKTSRGRRTGG